MKSNLLFPFTILAPGLSASEKPAAGPPMQMPPMAVTFSHPAKQNLSTGAIRSSAIFPNPKPERGLRVLQPGCFARVRVPGLVA
jgi:hypothetical protein